MGYAFDEAEDKAISAMAKEQALYERVRKTNITGPQMEYINAIEEGLIQFDVRFDGTTRQEASAFISKYAPYYKDMNRVNNGLLPHWTCYPVETSYGPYAPSHFTPVPEILRYLRRKEKINREDLALRFDATFGACDGWSEM